MTRWLVCMAAAAEADALAAIEKEAFGAASWGEESVKAGVSAPYVSALLVFDGPTSGPAGFALWRRLATEAEILSLGVLPAARRRGAGDALLRAILAGARRADLSAVFLEVDARNVPARALYVKHGFTPIGVRRDYYKDGADAEVLRLEL